uniref:Uncharacterized protein n=1 Tax=Leptobrachium leishanense TaxID=445787 RepID=A0A8C5QKU3_9ANUR
HGTGSWILRPPGGGSSFSFDVGDQPAQPSRRHKMASNIFGVPDYNSMAAPSVPEPGDSGTASSGNTAQGAQTLPTQNPLHAKHGQGDHGSCSLQTSGVRNGENLALGCTACISEGFPWLCVG